MMSFSSLPDEVVCEIFSYISSIDAVGDKIRLERVSKRFRRLIQDGRSWKFNTKLDLDGFRSGDFPFSVYGEHSPAAVAAFLVHAPKVNILEFSHGGQEEFYKASVLSQLFVNLPKLKITSLRHTSPVDDQSGPWFRNCAANMELVTWCLANFQSTLTKFEYDCCSNLKCRTLAAVVELLPSCRKLTHLAIGSVDLGGIPILEMLAGKQLTHVNFNGCKLSAQLAAKLLNSVPGHTVRSFHSSKLNFAQFLETVGPAVLASLNAVSLQDSDNSFEQNALNAPKLIEVGPDLEEFVWNIDATKEENRVTALEIAQMLDLVFQYSERPKPLRMRLNVKGKKINKHDSFSQDLWRQICLLDSSKRGTKRSRAVKQWQRKLKRGNIECEVNFDYI